MRPLAFVLALCTTTVAAAQEPIAPAVAQADDAEVPPTTPPTTPPPAPVVAPQPPRVPLLLSPPQGWRYQVVDGPPTRTRHDGLIIAGAVMFSVGWVANLQAGIPTGQWLLDVPLFGPLMELANIPTDSQPFSGWIDFLLVSDALVQIGGFAMLVAGGSTWAKKPGVQRLELVPCGAGAAIRGSF
ncbi:MAG TPA: hypothetical protein VF997_06035 [Polyangia bacterium]